MSAIEFEDVVRFCELGNDEGFFLEYKREMPDGEAIAKTVAAFANTYGGLLVIGINAPQGKPLRPFDGITFDPGQDYELKIEQIILSNVREPVFPEVRICPERAGRTFIVVRVQESPLTPHRVGTKGRVYIRTGQSSRPSDEANWDQIEWLRERRGKSELLRTVLRTNAERYFENACFLREISHQDISKYFAMLQLSSVPHFPSKPYVDFSRMEAIARTSSVLWTHGYSTLEMPGNLDFQSIQGGVQALKVINDDGSPPHGKGFKYCYLNALGVYEYRQHVGRGAGSPDLKEREFNYNEIFWRVALFLASTARFYSQLGFFGTLDFEVILNGCLGTWVIDGMRGDRYQVPANGFTWQRQTIARELPSTWRSVLPDLLHDIAWSLGIKRMNKSDLAADIARFFPPQVGF